MRSRRILSWCAALLTACATSSAPTDATIVDSGADAGRAECVGFGTWRVGPSTHEPRDSAGLTLLPDGSVLSIGGHRVLDRAIRTVEVLADIAGPWRLGAAMLREPEGIGDVVVLADGRVLVPDAYSNFPATAPTELYDPALDVWTASGAMLEPPSGSVTALADGRILTTGGMDWVLERPLARAEIHDPATATWSATGSMSVPRFRQVVQRLHDGRVLVAGGFSEVDPIATVEIFDPATERFVPAASMRVARRSACSVLLPDGRVLVVGGRDRVGGAAQATAEIFDPAAGAWTDTGAMRQPRSLFDLTLLRDGRVLATGGVSIDDERFDTTEVWDPETGEWSSAGCMSRRRSHHRALLLPSGEVLVVGGFDRATLRSVEIYTP